MDGTKPFLRAEELHQKDVLRVGQIADDAPNAALRLKHQLGDGPFATVFLFASARSNFMDLSESASRAFGEADVVCCTTAGEIGLTGYETGQIVAIGLPKKRFMTRSVLLKDVSDPDPQTITDDLVCTRLVLEQEARHYPNGFAFMVVDGMSQQEEVLAAALSPALGTIPLLGGSAGIGEGSERAFVSLNGQCLEDAGIVTLVKTSLESRVFSLDHMIPSETRMVVTDADPTRRIVQTINAEPAAAEYARIMGVDVAQLDAGVFAANPVVVRIGKHHHVRAIRSATPEGELVFYSAIDEGVVLTRADTCDMARHLEQTLSGLTHERAPAAILGCDCILRRIEAEQTQSVRDVSEILVRHNVLGFSTYGEQVGPLHVNHTMTGVALYAPVEGDRNVTHKS